MTFATVVTVVLVAAGLLAVSLACALVVGRMFAAMDLPLPAARATVTDDGVVTAFPRRLRLVSEALDVVGAEAEVIEWPVPVAPVPVAPAGGGPLGEFLPDPRNAA